MLVCLIRLGLQHCVRSQLFHGIIEWHKCGGSFHPSDTVSGESPSTNTPRIMYRPERFDRIRKSWPNQFTATDRSSGPYCAWPDVFEQHIHNGQGITAAIPLHCNCPYTIRVEYRASAHGLAANLWTIGGSCSSLLPRTEAERDNHVYREIGTSYQRSLSEPHPTYSTAGE